MEPRPGRRAGGVPRDANDGRRARGHQLRSAVQTEARVELREGAGAIVSSAANNSVNFAAAAAAAAAAQAAAVRRGGARWYARRRFAVRRCHLCRRAVRCGRASAPAARGEVGRYQGLSFAARHFFTSGLAVAHWPCDGNRRYRTCEGARPAWVALWAGAKPVHSVSAALGRSPGPALRRRRRRRP